MYQDQQTQRAEVERAAALERYGILDTDPETGYDDIVLLATRICETPVALVSLVTKGRQWFKARIGFPPCETPLGQSVCAHALIEPELLIVPDLTLDARTRHNTLVTGDPHIRFYAGAVLRTPEGVAVGTLCVIDTVARPAGLTPMQIDSLLALARQVMVQLEMRRVLAQRDEAMTAAALLDAASRQHQDLLRHELNHRLKNVLAIVQAIVSQTLRSTTDIEDVRAALSSRIMALANAQDVLVTGAAQAADLSAIIHNAVRPHDDTGQRVSLAGPSVDVGPEASLMLTLAIHELATNAGKYGALSRPGGNVDVRWELTPSQAGWDLGLSWQERGGPLVSPPTRHGFGSRLIERALAAEIGGKVALTFAPLGLECRLHAPLSGLSRPPSPSTAPN